ncbi:hypothetical protein MKW92_051740 [Papaver armeniacum]|nr:hypothetical protein MKW92_051740 [Papaver armeniacum]
MAPTISTTPEEQTTKNVVHHPVQVCPGPILRLMTFVVFCLLKGCKTAEKLKTTIFTKMSMLAIKHGAINLNAAIRLSRKTNMPGMWCSDLNSAVAARFKKDSGLGGCTEAIAATMLGLINPGNEVILSDIKIITLRPPNFSIPIDELKSIISKNTRAILVNTPHNPTGKMFSREELGTIASLCIENDVLVFSDEVYDKLAFEADHISIASLPGMYERTVTMNSLRKTFSLTGWKIGWTIAPPHLDMGNKLFRTSDTYYEELKKDYLHKKGILVQGLKAAGFVVHPSSGTYFVMVDHTSFGFENDVAFCEHLIKSGMKNLVRFTFCKDDDTLRAAIERMKTKLKK